MPLRVELDLVDLVLVAQFREVGMPEQRVVVENDLGIERDRVAGLRQGQRVDLDQARVELDESAMQLADDLAATFDLPIRKAEPAAQARDVAGLELAVRAGSSVSNAAPAARSSMPVPPQRRRSAGSAPDAASTIIAR